MKLSTVLLTIFLGMGSISAYSTCTASYLPERIDLHSLKTLNSQDYDKVILVAQEILSKDPRSLNVYEPLVRASAKQGILEHTIAFLKAQLSRRPNNPYLLYGLALCHHQKKEYEIAAECLVTAIRQSPCSHKPYALLALIYQAQGNLNSAIEFLHRLERSHSGTYYVFFGLATAYRLKVELNKALLYADKTIQLNAKDPWAHLLKAAVLYDLRKVHDAVGESKQAERLAETSGEPEILAEAYLNVARGLGLLRDFPAAFQYIDRSLHISEQLGDPRLQDFAFYLKAGYSNLLDKTADAVEYYVRAERFALLGDDKERQAWTALRTGELYRTKLNEYSKATDKFLQALDLFKEIHEDAGTGYAYRNLGEMLALAGETDKAIDFYKQALQLVRSPFGNTEAILGSLGNAFMLKEDYTTALDYYQQTLHAGLKSEARLYLNVTYWAIAKTYMKMGLYDKARDYFETGLRLSRARKRPQLEGFCLKGIGDASLRLEKLSQAEQSYQAALTMGRTLGYEDLLWEAYEGLGDLRLHQGDYESAFQYYRNAVDLIEAVRKRLTPKEGSGFSETNLKAYHTLVQLLVTLSHKTQRRDYAELAFYYAEKAKASNLLDLMRRGHLPELLHLDQSLKTRLDETQDALNIKHQELIALHGERNSLLSRYNFVLAEKTKGQIADLELAVQHLDNQKAALMTEIKERYPRFSAFYEPAILNVQQIQKQLHDDETLLEYLVTEHKIIAFLVGKSFFSTEELPVSEKELRALVQNASTLFTKNRSHVNDPEGANIHLNELHTLYKVVFQPLAKHIPARNRLVVVPDALLSYIPFEMLVTHVANNPTPAKRSFFRTLNSELPAHYLLEDYPISYSYAASLLGPATAGVDRSEHTDQIPLLAMGNPTFAHDAGRSHDGSTPNRLEHLDSLPHGEAEVRNIRKFVPGGRLLMKDQATETAFKQLASKSKVIHLATHSRLDDQNPLYSCIAFAADSQANGKGEDGYLYLYETLNLNLHADLVILSACDTASGHLRRGEALDTMSRAFLSAGVASVVATLWPISDSPATVDLMTRFYKQMAKGVPKRDALRMAKLDLVKAGTYDNPFFWAPFILIGNADSIVLDDGHFRMHELHWALLVSISLAVFSCFLFLTKKNGRRKSRR